MTTLFRAPLNAFNRLNYVTKFVLVSLLFIAPLAITLWLLAQQQNASIAVAESEIEGVTYLRPLNTLLTDTLEHRRLVQQYAITKDAALPSQIAEVQSRIETDLDAVQEVDSQYSAKFGTSQLLSNVITEWEALRPQALTIIQFDNTEVHAPMLNAIDALMTQVGNESQLILDPQLDTFYLANLVLNKIPNQQALTADTIMLVETINLRQDVGLDSIELTGLLSRLEASNGEVDRDVATAYSRTSDSNLEGVISPLQQDLSEEIISFARLIRSNLITTTSPNFSHPAFPTSSQHVVTDNALLFTTAADNLVNLLQRRIDQLKQRQLNTLISSIALAALAFGLGVFIFQAISRPLAQLTQTAKQMAAGNLAARAYVASTDEVGTLANTFNDMAAQLQQTLGNLEKQVAERTQTVERRTLQLATASEVARTASSELDPGKLLTQAVGLIQQRFDLYYVGAFLVDDQHQYAVLHAGTGAAGRSMLANQHKLEIGGQSMIGQAISQQTARIALDVGAEAVRFNNPYLPRTRSEMALPLVARGRSIGALTIQSDQSAAFTPEDIVALQGMADLIAIALDNARLFQESQQALTELTNVHKGYISQAWANFAKTAGADKLPTYTYDEQAFIRGETVTIPNFDRLNEALQPLESEDATTLTVPIRLREQLIGALAIESDDGRHSWTADELALIEAVVEQTALSLENARLLQETENALAETRRLADREQVINTISNKIRRLPSVESVLTTALVELGRTLGANKGLVRLGAGSRRTAQLEERNE
jgi:GAF domain-containing protein/methyl-accepting chemotaxis protein